MDTIDDRFLVYTTILFFCSVIGVMTGLVAAFATFCMVAVGVELAYFLGGMVHELDHSGTSF